MSEAVKARVACGGSTGVSDHADAVSLSGPLHQACRLLRLEGAEELQDLIASLILSECVYKKLELDEAGVAAKVTEFVSGFPPGWVQLQAVQLSLSGIPQHYLIATSPTSMYVAFMGTKQFQDILADANLLHTPVWAESARLAADRQSIPAAHRGFLERARAIHVEQLYELAVSRGLRLVLCGHSLGGAVAKLCTLRLLRELPDWPRPRVRCIAFATPAVGNAALAELVESAGWAGHFSTYYLPEDQLVRLISFSQAKTSSSSSSGNCGGSVSAAAGGGNGGNTSGNGGGRVRAERRRRAKERAAQRGAVGRPAAAGGEVESAAMAPALLTAAAEAAATSAAGLAAAARLDEATLGRLGSGDAAAATAAAAPAAAMAPQPCFRLPRPPSVSSIASASSCASAVTSSTTPGAGSVSSSTSSRSVRRDGSFGDASSDDACATLEPRDSPASRIPLTRGAAERPGSDGDLSLCTLPPPSHRPSQGSGAEASSSFAESLDEDQAGVALAMEEILAPGPDALEAAAAAGVALSGQPPADLAAAQREALYGNAGGSWGLRLALGRKRVLRRLRRLAARARIPLPKALLPVSRYHTFGEQWFVTDEGALSPEELEVALRQQKAQDQPQQPQQHVQPQQHQLGAAVTVAAAAATAVGPAAAAAAPEGTRGFFSFHRMVAYRQRHADLLSRVVRSAAGAERQEPSSAELVLQPQQAVSISGGAATAAVPTVAVAAPYNSVHVSDSLLPRISVQHAVLRGVLPEDPAGSRANLDAASRNRTRLEPRSGAAAAIDFSGDDGAAAGSAAADAAAAAGRPATGVAPVVSQLLSWVWGGGGGGGLYRSGSGGGGGRPGGPDDTVRLDLELDGHNLQYCRKVCVTLVRDGAEVAAGATAAAAGVAAAAPTGSASSPAATSVAAAAADRGAGAAMAAATARVAPAPASGRTARWVPFVIARGGGGTAGTAAANATPAQQPQRETAGTAAAAAGHASSSPLPSLSSSSPSPPGPATAAAAVAAAAPGPASATEVPCEVVQVLYAQPYSDEANPPPLHPVSLFRNSLHHFAGNLISRCRLRGQGVGPGGLASLAAAGSASASASTAALAGGGALAGRNGGYGGPWRRFRFQHSHRPTVNGSSNGSDSSSNSTITAVSAISSNAKIEGTSVAFDLRQFPCVLLPGGAGSSGSAAGAAGKGGGAAATVAAHAVVEMPSRLLLRVTLPRSVARGLLDGTLPGRLVVSARSDFHELSAAPVAVQRPRVAILGTSPYAASLVQAALSAPAALAAASLDGRAAAAGGGSAAAAAAGVAAWVPPAVAWALAAVRGATAAATVRRRAADAAAESAASASRQNANSVQESGSVANSRLAVQATGGVDATGTTAATSTALPQRTGGHVAPWLTQIAAQTSMPRLRARMGKLRWGIRQSLAAAAVGVAAASAAGATSAAAAVGAAAVVASTVAAFSSDGGASVLANAAVTVAAVVAAAAAAATAFSGSEAAVLVVAAASAAAMAVAAATSSGEGIISPPPAQQQQQAPSAMATGVLSSASLPAPLAAPLPGATQAQAKPAIAPAAVPQAPPRWVLRFGARPAGGQAGARNAQARGGGRAAAATVSAASARSDASGVSRPNGRGWALWWTGRAPPPPEDGAPAGRRPAAVAAAPPAQRWLSWPLPAAARQVRGTLAASRTQTPTAAAPAATDLGPAAAAAAAQHGRPVIPVVAAAAAAAAPSAAKPTKPLSPAVPAEPRLRPPGWFPPLGAAQRQLVTAVADATGAAAAGRRAAGAGSAVAAAVSLTQLRAQLLGSLRAGSGRAALPLPPGVLSDGLELCNVMVEPLRRTWGSGRAGAAAAAAGQHLLPRRSGRGGTPPAAVAAAAPLAPVPAAMLWKGRCPGPSERLDTATTSPPSAAHSAAAPVLAAGLAVPGLASPRAAAEAACAAWDGAAAAAAVAVLGVMPARDGCPELVGVAPFAAVRRMEEGLRRQVLQRGIWWRALLGGVVGALLRPVALVGMLGRLPGWGIMQVLRRGHLAQGDGGAPLAQAGAASSGVSAAAGATVDARGAAAASASGAERQPSDWGALLVVASCRDPLRVLRGRDMEALRSRAADAGCPVVPVLLTCAESPPARRAAAARALATACGVAPGEVRALVLEAALLHQPAAAIPRADLAAVWRGTADCEGAAELRSAVRQAVAAAAQAERQEPQQQQQSPLLGAQW